MRSRSSSVLLLVALTCATLPPRASAQLALPAWMRVRGAQAAAPPASLPSSEERDEAVWRSSWMLAVGTGLLAGGAGGAAYGVASRCKGDGMSFTVPLGAVVGTAGLLLTAHSALALRRLRERQPLPKGLARSVVPKSLAFAVATAGLLVAAALPHARGCSND